MDKPKHPAPTMTTIATQSTITMPVSMKAECKLRMAILVRYLDHRVIPEHDRLGM